MEGVEPLTLREQIEAAARREISQAADPFPTTYPALLAMHVRVRVHGARAALGAALMEPEHEIASKVRALLKSLEEE